MAGYESARRELPSTLDLLAATPLREVLRAHLENGSAIVLDGSKVERVSTACLQVLLAAALVARRRGGSFHLNAPSPALFDAVTDLGLIPHLLS
jgi:anti-anti-sigma regulatory factor